MIRTRNPAKRGTTDPRLRPARHLITNPEHRTSKEQAHLKARNVRRQTDSEIRITSFFDTLLTVHLSIFILVIIQLDAQNLFNNKFISCLYMFRAPCAHSQEVKIVLYSLWYHYTETSEWSKITKITTITKIYEYEHIVVKFKNEINLL